jgi:glycosyltransferase involved in cell wall biosynthesis
VIDLQAAMFLMIYIEPTPYIIGLIREVKRQAPGNVDVLFLKENVTQAWNLTVNDMGMNINYLNRSSAFSLVRGIFGRSWACLHLAGWAQPWISFSLLLAWFRRIPVAVESDTPLRPKQVFWKKAVKRLVYPVLFKMPKALLAGGARQMKYFQHYGVPSSRIHHMQMTVDIEYIQKRCRALGVVGRFEVRKKLGIEIQDVVFVYVGRLLGWKGVGNLIRAFNELCNIHSNIKLLIAGDGPEKQEIEILARENPSIKYLGRWGFEEIIGLYHASDVAVVPSFGEPWGLVVNEAMAAGLPVIASDQVGCVDDLVKHGENGLVFPAGDHEKLVFTMKQLLHDQAKRKEMGLNAQSLISKWTLREEAARIVNAWSNLIKAENE